MISSSNMLHGRQHVAGAVLCLLLAGACLAGVGCQKNQQGAGAAGMPAPVAGAIDSTAYFNDVTQLVGIDYVHTFGDSSLSNIIETVGSGVAFLDYDLDGFLDLYVVNGAYTEGISTGRRAAVSSSNRLYRNLHGRAFKDVTRRAGVADEQGYGMGVSVADYDNNGFPDIYIGRYGPNLLLHNNGDGTFSDVTRRAGVAGNRCTVSAVWLDYDNDGLLDLYAGNYLDYDPDYAYYYSPDGFPGPLAYAGQPDVLYHNLGNGKFADVTKEMGLYRPEGKMMGICATDYDNDGYVDLYIANDAMGNYLYRNVQGTRFEELAIGSGVALSEGGEATSSMAVDFADYNGDGRIDLFVSDIYFCALYRNEGDGVFSDVTIPSGIAAASGQFDSWGASFFDYDNDGDLDIFKVNGDVNHLFGQEDQLFENLGNGKFHDVSVERGRYFQRELVGRGTCFGDFDNDGDVDIFMVNLSDRGVLLRNEGRDGHSWIALQLEGTVSNRDGVGAKIRLTSGGRVQIAHKKSASGYLSQNDPRVHFGLGQAETVDRIEIVWPSGMTQVLKNIPARQVVRITEPGEERIGDAGN